MLLPSKRFHSLACKTGCSHFLRHQRYDFSRHVDGRFDVPGVSEVAGDINSRNVRLEGFRIVERNFGKFARFRFHAQLFELRQIRVATNQHKHDVVRNMF